MSVSVDTTPETPLKSFLVPPGEGRIPAIDVLGEPALIKLTGRDTASQAAVVQFEVPFLAGPPLHRHSREDEWFYVVSGEITWEIDGQRFNGGPGTSAYAPRGTVHAFQNFGQQTARLLVMVTPAGLDDFFADVDTMNRGLAQPDFARLEQLMNGYGMELLGPPLR